MIIEIPGLFKIFSPLKFYHFSESIKNKMITEIMYHCLAVFKYLIANISVIIDINDHPTKDLAKLCI